MTATNSMKKTAGRPAKEKAGKGHGMHPTLKLADNMPGSLKIGGLSGKKQRARKRG